MADLLPSLVKIQPNAVLCYVKGICAWFTTLPLDKQWGDDWNDAPYEHNAGTPYNDGGTVQRIYFDRGVMAPPCEGQINSSWSVEAINRRAVPWLSTAFSDGWDREHVHIWAGSTIVDMQATLEEAGGSLLVPLSAFLTRGRIDA